MISTAKEAIKYLWISKFTYLKYIRLGRINAVKAGSRWRTHRSEVHRFLTVRFEQIQIRKAILYLAGTRMLVVVEALERKAGVVFG